MTKSWSSEETQMKSLHQRPKAKTDINKVSILTVNTERERERERESENSQSPMRLRRKKALYDM